MHTLAKKVNLSQVRTNMFRLMMIMTTLMMAYPMVFASAGTAGDKGEEVISGILAIVYLIMNVLGIIFVIIGFVKLIIAHAQEDAPGQQKAAMFIATGLVLIIARFVMNQIDFSGWVDTSTP